MPDLIYDTGVDESAPESILNRAKMLKSAGSLRAFLGQLSADDRRKLTPYIERYKDAAMKRKGPKTPEVKKQAKGAIGNLVEMICFGRTHNNKSEADFPKCEVELKVTGLREHDDEAKERVSLSMISKKLIHGTDEYSKEMTTLDAYNNFGPIKSASSVLFVVYKYANGKNYLDAEIKGVFNWKPKGKQKRDMQDDFIIIRRMCDHGFAHCLGEGLGEYMGAATKSGGDEEGFENPAPVQNLAALMHAAENDLNDNKARLETFKTKLKAKLKKGGKIKRRCYSLKRTSVTEIIAKHLSCP